MAARDQIEDASSSGPSLGEAAESLLAYLRQAKYPIGVDHHLRVQRLLTSLAAGGRAPSQAEQLGSWVGPVVCQSAKEQEKFREDFAAWVRIYGGAKDATKSGHEAELTAGLQEVQRGWTRSVALVSGAIALLVMGLVVWVAVRWDKSRPTEQTRVEKHAAKAALVKDQRVSGKTVAGGVVLLMIAGMVVLVFWRRAKLKAFLVQREGSAPGERMSLGLAANLIPPIYSPQLLTAAAQGFGSYRRLPSETLNIKASVAATTREAGRFIPIYAERPTVPEYLVLIDKRSGRDVFAQFADGIVRALEDSAVTVDAFYFDAIPQQCYSRRDRRPVTIRALAERYPEHRLLVFTDGSGFVSPVTNQYSPSMSAFENWETRTMLTPNPRSDWGPLERGIAGAGWMVFAAEQAEVAAAAHGVTPEPKDDSFVGGVPRVVAEDERRWMSRVTPAPEEVRELLRSLRLALGASGFYWLCACAAYPAVDWTIVLFLGSNLRDEKEQQLLSEGGFLALSRLPWFRRGRMPKWCRMALLGQLRGEQEAAVREVLQRLVSGPVQSYQIEVQQELRRPLTWLTRQMLREKKATEDEGVLQDQMFLEFLSGSNPGSVRLPDRVGASRDGFWKRVEAQATELRGRRGVGRQNWASAEVVGLLAMVVVNWYLRAGFTQFGATAQQDLKFSDQLWEYTVAGFFWGYALAAPLAGSLVDRYGARFIGGVGMAFCAFTAWMEAFSWKWANLMVLHTMEGVALSITFPVICSVLAKGTGRRRGLINGLTEVAPRLVVTPMLATLGAVHAAWRSYLFVGGLAAVAAIFPWMVEPRSSDVGEDRFLKALYGSAKVACLIGYCGYCFAFPLVMTYAFAQLTDRGNGAPRIIQAVLLTGCAVLSGWWADDWRAKNLRVNGALYASLGLALASLIGFWALGGKTWAIGLTLVSTCGLGIATPNLWATLQSMVPLRSAGRWGGVMALAGGLTSMLVAPAIAQFALPGTFILAGVALFLCACVVLVLGRDVANYSPSFNSQEEKSAWPPPQLSLNAIMPVYTNSGGPAFTLSAYGGGYTSATTITWNGTSLPTTFVSTGELTGRVSAPLIASSGNASVTVSESGRTSPPALTFVVSQPWPEGSSTSARATRSQEGLGKTKGYDGDDILAE